VRWVAWPHPPARTVTMGVTGRGDPVVKSPTVDSTSTVSTPETHLSTPPATACTGSSGRTATTAGSLQPLLEMLRLRRDVSSRLLSSARSSVLATLNRVHRVRHVSDSDVCPVAL